MSMLDRAPFRSISFGRFLRQRPVAICVALLLCTGCNSGVSEEDFVARVGDEYLSRSEVELVMSTLPSIEDSASAVTQFVNQWVTNALLAQEARAIGLDEDPHVQRLISDSEKSVLVSSLMNQIYSDEGDTIPTAEVMAYYELNKSRLKTVESYVKIRYLSNADREVAREARRLLQRAMRGSDVDSLWTIIVNAHAGDQTTSMQLSGQHYPETRILGQYQEIGAAIPQLGNGQISQVIGSGGLFHVVQVVDRVPAGSEPYFEWVNEELKRQLTLQNRKEALARKIQELRTNALAKNILEVK